MYYYITGACWATVAVGLSGVAVTAVYFVQTTPLVIVGGCEDGRINCVRWIDFGKIENKCLNRYCKQNSVSSIINNINAVVLILRMELKCYVETLDYLQL